MCTHPSPRALVSYERERVTRDPICRWCPDCGAIWLPGEGWEFSRQPYEAPKVTVGGEWVRLAEAEAKLAQCRTEIAWLLEGLKKERLRAEAAEAALFTKTEPLKRALEP
jgi:hypothetical protein